MSSFVSWASVAKVILLEEDQRFFGNWQIRAQIHTQRRVDTHSKCEVVGPQVDEDQPLMRQPGPTLPLRSARRSYLRANHHSIDKAQ